VLALPEVTLLSPARCEGLKMESPGRVSQVLYRMDGAEQPAAVTADLVVDASGRSSTLDNWLMEMGLPVPRKRVVKAKITYASVNFERPEKGHPDFNVAYQLVFAPHTPRGGAILAVEGNRWVCSLFGFGDHLPSTDDAGYLDFAKSLDNAHLAEQINRRTHQETIRRYTNVNNQWRPYHKVRQWPDRLIAIGDAVCVFNPVYAQGMTVAALEAELLHRTLAKRRERKTGLDGMSRAYQRTAARIILVPWILSTNSDLMWHPHHQPISARIAHWYNKHLFAVSVRDAGVWSRFVRVFNMVSPPSILFHPAVVSKVVGHALTRRKRNPA